MRRVFEEWRNAVQNKVAIFNALKETSTYPSNKTYLTYPLKLYELSLRNFKINSIILDYVKRVRERIFYRKMGQKLYRCLKKKTLEFSGP